MTFLSSWWMILFSKQELRTIEDDGDAGLFVIVLAINLANGLPKFPSP